MFDVHACVFEHAKKGGESEQSEKGERKTRESKKKKKKEIIVSAFFSFSSTHRQMRFRGVLPKARWPRDLICCCCGLLKKRGDEFFCVFFSPLKTGKEKQTTKKKNKIAPEEEEEKKRCSLTCRRPQERVPEEPEDVRRRRGVQHPACPDAGHELSREIKDGKLGHAAGFFFFFFFLEK